MDTTLLRATYDALASAAEAGPFNPPDADEWPVELIVAHAIATNRTLVLLGIRSA